MVYFVMVFASISLLGGICWLLVDRVILWFARKRHTEGKVAPFLLSTQGRVGLWRLRIFGISWIIIALFLFFMTFAPAWLAHVPSYFIVIPLALLFITGFILLRVAIVLSRRQESPSKVDRNPKTS